MVSCTLVDKVIVGRTVQTDVNYIACDMLVGESLGQEASGQKLYNGGLLPDTSYFVLLGSKTTTKRQPNFAVTLKRGTRLTQCEASAIPRVVFLR